MISKEILCMVFVILKKPANIAIENLSKNALTHIGSYWTNVSGPTSLFPVSDHSGKNHA
jgi:hypothetical protein